LRSSSSSSNREEEREQERDIRKEILTPSMDITAARKDRGLEITDDVIR